MDEKKIEKWECVSKKMTALCKKGFSPFNLKKGAAVVVLVAVAAGAGKVTLKKMRFDRRQAEAAAKVELAQKLAVERNEPLLSSDEVLGKIASLLGTDEGSVTLKGLRLAEAKPDLREHKEHKDKEKRDHDRKFFKKDHDNRDRVRGGEDPRTPQLTPQEGPNKASDQAPAPTGGNPADFAAPTAQNKALPPQGMQPMAGPMGSHRPVFYEARVDQGNMSYEFLLNAQTGEILHSKVHQKGIVEKLFS